MAKSLGRESATMSDDERRRFELRQGGDTVNRATMRRGATHAWEGEETGA